MRQTKLTSGGWERKHFPAFKNQPPDPDGSYHEWLEALCIRPISAIEWHLDPFFKQGPRVTTDVYWLWIMRGRGEIILGNEERKVPVRPGDHVFITPNTRHIACFPSRHGWSSISVHFFADLFGSMDLLTLMGFPDRFRESPNGELGEMAMRLVREFALKPPGWKSAMAAWIRLALLHVVRHGGRLFQPAPVNLDNGDVARFFPLLKSIDDRLGDSGLSMHDLARSIGLSDTRFRVLFKRLVGLSPVAYIHRRRIEQSCILLRQTDQSIKQIGAACGFADEPFFYRVFRRRIGTTPKCYRENLRT